MTKKTTLKIIAASSVAIFSLATLVGGAFSWFTLAMKQSPEVDPFEVVNLGTCELYSVDVIKFDYSIETYSSGGSSFTMIDYFNPERGSVNRYGYDKERNQFGHTVDEEWKAVAAMNVYDPVDFLIHGTSLQELYCNAVYVFKISSLEFTDVNLNASVVQLSNVLKEEDEIFLSNVVDYDIFFENDLLETNPLFNEYEDPDTHETVESEKLYYPSFMEDKSVPMTENEEIYYKVSYLSSIKASHEHFYGQEDTEKSLAFAKSVSFGYDDELESGLLTFYVNVNYAPSQLEYLVSRIYQGSIRAVYDYAFKFFFFRPEES